MQLGYRGTHLNPHTWYICTADKTNKRDCLKQSCLFVFRAYKDTGGGVCDVFRRAGTTQTQKKVKLGHSNCCYLSYFSIICILQVA